MGKPEPAAAIVAGEDEVLATGWEAETPPTDTLLRQAMEATAACSEALSRACGHEPVVDGGLHLAPTGGQGVLGSRILVIAPPGALSAAEVTERAREVLGREPAVIVSPFPVEGARSAGWQLIGHPPLMVRRPGASLPEPAPGVELREVLEEQDEVTADRILVEGYPVPEHQPFSGSLHHLAGSGLRTWLALVDGAPAGVASAAVGAGMVSVENVAVLPTARGRGVGLAVTVAAVAVDPTLPAVLLASDEGRPIYDRLGFEALARVTCWYLPGPD